MAVLSSKAQQDGLEIDELTIQIATLLHDVVDHKIGYTDDDRENMMQQYLIPLKVKKK